MVNVIINEPNAESILEQLVEYWDISTIIDAACASVTTRFDIGEPDYYSAHINVTSDPVKFSVSWEVKSLIDGRVANGETDTLVAGYFAAKEAFVRMPQPVRGLADDGPHDPYIAEFLQGLLVDMAADDLNAAAADV